VNNIQVQQLEIYKQFVLNRLLVLKELFSLEIEATEEAESVSDKLNYIDSLFQQKVNKTNVFSDQKWDYREDSADSSVNISPSALIINFSAYPEIPSFIINEVKCLTALYSMVPTSFKCRGRKKKSIKPVTVVRVTRLGLAFLNHLYCELTDEYGGEYVHEKLNSLSDLSRDMFESSASSFETSFCIDLKIFFDNVSHQFAIKNIFGDTVECDDSHLFDWKVVAGTSGVRVPDKILPEKMYEKMTLHSSLYVTEFLSAMGEDVDDIFSRDYLYEGMHENTKWKATGITKDLFEAYLVCRLRESGYDYDVIRGALGDVHDNDYIYRADGEFWSRPIITARVVDATGLTIKNIYRLIATIKQAAQYLVAQFTGMRPSELADIPLNCLVIENGIPLIKSRVTKGKENLLKGLFDDRWVAIPTITDAVKALTLLNKIFRSEYLFSSMKTVPLNSKPKRLSSASFAGQIKVYIYLLFGEKKPFDISYNSYMTRHTLAYQMFRADVGLPLITYQLKHLVEGVEQYTSNGAYSDTTLGYGGIGESLAKGTRGLRKLAEIESVKSVMDPDGVYIGAKGKEHKERLEKYFSGYIASGYSKEEIFEAMAEQGMALIDVGQGFCYGGQAEDFDESIPCIGSLRCNPIRCKNAIVTKANAPKWRGVYMTNKANLNKPEFADNIVQIKEAMAEASSVLKYLGEDVDL